MLFLQKRVDPKRGSAFEHTCRLFVRRLAESFRKTARIATEDIQNAASEEEYHRLRRRLLSREEEEREILVLSSFSFSKNFSSSIYTSTSSSSSSTTSSSYAQPDSLSSEFDYIILEITKASREERKRMLSHDKMGQQMNALHSSAPIKNMEKRRNHPPKEKEKEKEYYRATVLKVVECKVNPQAILFDCKKKHDAMLYFNGRLEEYPPPPSPSPPSHSPTTSPSSSPSSSPYHYLFLFPHRYAPSFSFFSFFLFFACCVSTSHLRLVAMVSTSMAAHMICRTVVVSSSTPLPSLFSIPREKLLLFIKTSSTSVAKEVLPLFFYTSLQSYPLPPHLSNTDVIFSCSYHLPLFTVHQSSISLSPPLMFLLLLLLRLLLFHLVLGIDMEWRGEDILYQLLEVEKSTAPLLSEQFLEDTYRCTFSSSPLFLLFFS